MPASNYHRRGTYLVAAHRVKARDAVLLPRILYSPVSVCLSVRHTPVLKCIETAERKAGFCNALCLDLSYTFCEEINFPEIRILFSETFP